MKNGYFIDDGEDLAEKIISLLENPKKSVKMGEESRLMAQKFSWNKVVSDIIQIAKKH